MLGDFDRFVLDSKEAGILVTQPRMGMGSLEAMRSGLSRLKASGLPTIGTITIDSYTRVGDFSTPLQRLAAGEELNGYPLVSHKAFETRTMLHGLIGPEFPVQVRHGTSLPTRVFQRMVEVGLSATEGGPVSYCLPYSRTPLREAVGSWKDGCKILSAATNESHIESFGGCLLGQLCPPSLLVAVGVLECLFFRQQGINNLSLSFAQGTLSAQDRGALRALRELAREYLSDVSWHVVLYSYMGLFPRTPDGAASLIVDSAQLARDTLCERIIVKTVSEAWQIPSVSENLTALVLASEDSGHRSQRSSLEDSFYEEVLAEAQTLIDTVLNLHTDVGLALIEAFQKGYLDIPFCIHPDNQGMASSIIDDRGALAWGELGNLPLKKQFVYNHREPSAEELFKMLNFVADHYDAKNQLGYEK